MARDLRSKSLEVSRRFWPSACLSDQRIFTFRGPHAAHDPQNRCNCKDLRPASAASQAEYGVSSTLTRSLENRLMRPGFRCNHTDLVCRPGLLLVANICPLCRLGPRWCDANAATDTCRGQPILGRSQQRCWWRTATGWQDVAAHFSPCTPGLVVKAERRDSTRPSCSGSSWRRQPSIGRW